MDKKHSPAFYTSLPIGALGIFKLIQTIIIFWSQMLFLALSGIVLIACIIYLILIELSKKQTQEEEKTRKTNKKLKN